MRPEDESRFEYFEDGTLRIVDSLGRSSAAEPICPICHQPIRLVLDMFSFTSGFQNPRFALAHARCVWVRAAFEDEAKKVQP